MQVHFEDQDFQFEIEDIDVSQSRHIYKQTGLSVRGLLDGLKEINPDALVALYWLMKAQNGTVVDMGKVNFPILRFAAALGDGLDAEKKEQAEERPTKPGAGTRTRK